MRDFWKSFLPRLTHLAILATLCLTAAAQEDDGDNDKEPKTIPHPLRIAWQGIRVEIEGPLATTTIEQIYVNDEDDAREITYAFRLPDAAAVHDLAMWIGGVPCPGVLYPRVTAGRIYREIVGNQYDPAILEYLGHGRWNLQVFPIPAKGSQKIRIVYTHMMPVRSGRVVYETPAVLECQERQDQFEFHARIRCPGGVRNVKAETHAMGLRRGGDGSVTAGFRADGDAVGPTDRIALSYVPARPPGPVFTWRDPDGKALFWAAAGSVDQMLRGLARSRTVVLVLDVSASMRGDSLVLLKAAADGILAGLGERDRVAIVTARGDAGLWRDRPVPASRENIDAARRYVRSLRARGGTDLAAAFRAAETFNTDPASPFYLVVLSDGDDLVGARGLSSLKPLMGIPANATPPAKNVRMHWLCIGAAGGFRPPRLPTRRGRAMYAYFLDDAEKFVKTFREQAAVGVPAGLRAEVVGAEDMSISAVRASYPQLGRGLIVSGRYAKGGQARVVVSGTLDDKPFSRSLSLPLPALPAGGPASRWALRRLGKLRAHLQAEAIWGSLEDDPADPKPLEQMVAISRKNRIVTRATAFLILETREDYISRGIRPPTMELAAGQDLDTDSAAAAPARPPASPGVERKIAYWRNLARRLRGRRQYQAAARAIDRLRELDPHDFAAALDAAILLEFEALRESVRLERGGALPTDYVCKGTWHEMLQPVDVVSDIPNPLALHKRPRPAPLPDLPGDREARAALQRRIGEVKFTRIGRRDAVARLAKAGGINIHPRWPALGLMGIRADDPVSANATNVTLGRALRKIVPSPGGVGFAAGGNVLSITTAEDAARKSATLIYDVRDLTYKPPGPRGLRPAHWHDLEGQEPAGTTRVGTIREKEPPVAENWSPMSQISQASPTEDPVIVPNFKGPRVELSGTGGGGFFDEDSYDEPPRPHRDDIRNLLVETIDPGCHHRPGGNIASARWFRGLLVITQTPANHRRIKDLLTKLRAHRPTSVVRYVPLAAIPEALFTDEATPTAWVLDLLEKARAGRLSRFSSVVVRKVGKRTFARIGGIWFDTALTGSSRIALVKRGSPAATRLLAARADMKAWFQLGKSVVVAVAANLAVSIDTVAPPTADSRPSWRRRDKPPPEF